MTDAEAEVAMARLREELRRLNAALHELVNVLAVIKAEVDLTVDRARRAIDAAYSKYPELLGGP